MRQKLSKKSKFSPTICIAAHVATRSSCNGVWDVNIWRVGDSRHRSYSNRYEEIHVAKDTKNRPLPRLQHVDASSYLILVIFQWQPFSNPLEHGVFVSSARFVSPLMQFRWPVYPIIWVHNMSAVWRLHENSSQLTQQNKDVVDDHGGILWGKNRLKPHDYSVTSDLSAM